MAVHLTIKVIRFLFVVRIRQYTSKQCTHCNCKIGPWTVTAEVCTWFVKFDWKTFVTNKFSLYPLRGRHVISHTFNLMPVKLLSSFSKFNINHILRFIHTKNRVMSVSREQNSFCIGEQMATVTNVVSAICIKIYLLLLLNVYEKILNIKITPWVSRTI